MNKESIQKMFLSDMGCAQMVLGEFAEETGLSIEELNKLGSTFDGGMMRGETCGAVIGAYLVIGQLAGYDGPDQLEQKGKMLGLQMKFNELFKEKRESFMCKELLNADISIPEGMNQIIEGGLMLEICPCIVMEAVDCLKQVLAEAKEEETREA